MPKFIVWQKREFMFYQEVEAASKSEALLTAEEAGEWEQDTNFVEYDYEIKEIHDGK